MGKVNVDVDVDVDDVDVESERPTDVLAVVVDSVDVLDMLCVSRCSGVGSSVCFLCLRRPHDKIIRYSVCSSLSPDAG
jgi:hypothetical protein